MNKKVYVNDIGTAIILDCKVNIADATSLTIAVKKPDGKLVTWTGTLEGTTSIKFVTVSGTLSIPGVWKLQAVVTTPAGTWRGRTADLQVYAPFE